MSAWGECIEGFVVGTLVNAAGSSNSRRGGKILSIYGNPDFASAAVQWPNGDETQEATASLLEVDETGKVVLT